MVRRDETRLPVEPIRPAYEQVADQIRSAILDGSLAPGERLPVELDLAQLLGVSRSTVREALRTLASQNLVTTARGVTGGTYVAHPDPEKVTEYLEASIGLLSGVDEVSVAELTEARKLLEVPACRLAATRSTPELVEQLRKSLAGMDRSVPAPDFEGNRMFHGLILEAAGNRLVSLITEPVFSVLSTHFARHEASPEFGRKVHDGHVAIMGAIERADGDEAGRLMEDHLDMVARTYETIERARRR